MLHRGKLFVAQANIDVMIPDRDEGSNMFWSDWQYLGTDTEQQ